MHRPIPFFLIVAALANLSPAVAQDARLADRALAALSERADEGTRFSFTVIGDTRHWTPIVQPQVFKDMIQQMNLLRPRFGINVGDLILGYTNDVDLLTREWDEFFRTVEQCQFPLIPVVGNHDVTSEVMQDIYLERVGPLYFSFDHGNAHFVCLSSDTVGSTGTIDAEQLEWLRADLATHSDAEHVFAFLHQPLWRNAGSGWGEAHALLLEAGLSAVFCGHQHHYEYEEIDGVPYIITGGGGSEMGRVTEAGDFHHFCLVTVDGPEVTIAVIPAGGVLDPHVVTREHRAAVLDLPNRITVEGIRLETDGSADQPTTIEIANPTDAAISGTVRWTHIPPGVSIEPTESVYTVDPRQTASLAFRVRVAGGLAALPHPAYEITYPVRADGTNVPVRGELHLLPAVPARRIAGPVTMDDAAWADAEALVLSSVEAVRSHGDVTWAGPQDLSAEFRATWDDDALYLRLDVTDDVFHQTRSGEEMQQEDSIQVGFDPKNNTVRPVVGPDDYEYGFALTPEGPQAWCYESATGRPKGLIGDIGVTAEVGEGGVRYLIRLPFTRLAPGKPEAGAVLGFSFIVNDSDGEGDHKWLEWTPGVGGEKDPSAFGDLVLSP